MNWDEFYKSSTWCNYWYYYEPHHGTAIPNIVTTTTTSPYTYTVSSDLISKYNNELNKILKNDLTKAIKEKDRKENMIQIISVEIEKEKKTIVDKTKRDENGNYAVTKIEVPVKTIVVFENGHAQTAYCDDSDEFNLEIGIGICITRELMYRMYGTKKYSTYNKLIRSGVKNYKNHEKQVNELLEKKAKKEAAEKARKAKEQKRRIKRAEKKKEREIEIMAEAMRRANADNK